MVTAAVARIAGLLACYGMCCTRMLQQVMHLDAATGAEMQQQDWSNRCCTRMLQQAMHLDATGVALRCSSRIDRAVLHRDAAAEGARFDMAAGIALRCYGDCCTKRCQDAAAVAGSSRYGTRMLLRHALRIL